MSTVSCVARSANVVWRTFLSLEVTTTFYVIGGVVQAKIYNVVILTVTRQAGRVITLNVLGCLVTSKNKSYVLA